MQKKYGRVKKTAIKFIKYTEEIIEMHCIKLNFDYIGFESNDNFRKIKNISIDYGNSVDNEYLKAKKLQ